MFDSLRRATSARTILLLLVCISVQGAACGNPPDERVERAERRSVTQLTLEENELTLAGAASKAEGSVRMNMDMVMEVTSGPGPSKVLTKADGIYDLETRRGQIEMKVVGSDPALSAMGTITAIIDGFVIYMKGPAFTAAMPPGKTWISFDMQAVGEELGIDLSQLSQLQGGQTFDYLAGATDVKKVGHEKVQGIQTTHYTAIFDYEALAAASDPDLAESLDRLIEVTGVSRQPVEAWLDDEDLVRKMVMEIPLPDMSPQEGSMLMAIEFSDYGDPVDIQVPDPSTAVDVLELQASASG